MILLLAILTAWSVCLCQTNVVLPKSEYEKLLSQRNKLRQEIVHIRTEMTVFKDSIINHYHKVEVVVKENNCEDFKKRILQLELNNKSLNIINIADKSTISKVRRRARPNDNMKVAVILLSTYCILYTLADLTSK